MGNNLRIINVRDGLFQFKFALESQLRWVMDNGLWSTDAAPEVLHPRPTRRDKATLEGRRCLRVRPRCATWFSLFFSRFVLTRLWLGLICVELGRIGWNGWFRPKFKKKKKVQYTPFELNIKPYFSPLHTNTKLQLSTSPHTSVSHSSLCSVCSLPLCLCLVSPVAMRHSATRHSLSLLTSIHSFFSSLSRILNLGIDIKLSILVWSLIFDLWLVNMWFVNLSFQS